MTTETQEQTAATATEAVQQTSETTEKEVTLDDVYRDAGLDKVVAQETQQQPARQETQDQPTKVEPSSIPDPYDTENFKAFIARQASGTTELHKAVSVLTQHLTAQQQRAAFEATKADIDKSVKAIDEIAQIGKPKVIEAYLDAMVREDPRMKALWDNRVKNPTAWTNALKVAAKKMSEEFSVKVDPELQRAQRARKESQQQMATTSEKDNANEWEGLSQQDFERKWESLKSQWS